MIQPMRPGPRQSSNGSARPSIDGDHQAGVPISGRARESTVGGIQGVWTPSETRLAPDSTRWIGGSSGCSEGEKRDPATAAAMKRNDRVAPASPRPAGRQGAWPQPTSARRPLDGALRRPTGRAGRRRREEDCDRPPQIPYKINWLDRNGEAEPASSAGRRILFLYLARLPRKITGNVDPILLVFEDQSAEPEERGAADPQGFDRSLRR